MPPPAGTPRPCGCANGALPFDSKSALHSPSVKLLKGALKSTEALLAVVSAAAAAARAPSACFDLATARFTWLWFSRWHHLLFFHLGPHTHHITRAGGRFDDEALVVELSQHLANDLSNALERLKVVVRFVERGGQLLGLVTLLTHLCVRLFVLQQSLPVLAHQFLASISLHPVLSVVQSNSVTIHRTEASPC